MIDITRDPRAGFIYDRLTASSQPMLRQNSDVSNDDVVIDSDWKLDDRVNTEMTRMALDDLHRFLKDSLEIQLSGETEKTISVSLVSEGRHKRAHTIITTPDKIEICAETEWGAACGLYHLQRVFKLRRAPIIKQGTIHATPTLDPAIVCLAFKTGLIDELNFPEAYHENYLVRISRAGYTGFHLNLSLEMFTESEIFPELNRTEAKANINDLNKIIALARKYALDVYLSVYIHPYPKDHPIFQNHPETRGSRLVCNPLLHNLCGSSSRVIDFYREQFSQLFTQFSELAGVFLITGCEGLVHCYTAPYPEPNKPSNCPRCATLDPETVVADLCNAIAEAIKAVAPDVHCIFWTYKQHVWTDPAGKKFISKLSKDCELMANFDTDASFELEGVQSDYFDYSLSCIGPTPVFTAQVETAKENSIEFLAKVENGSPLEFYSVPSIPAMTRWGKKYHNIINSGASGAMFNWQFIGYTESLSSELAAWMSWTSDKPWQELLHELAVRDFSSGNAEKAVTAWSLFDQAMAFHPFSNSTAGYFKGPFYIGFTQPLILDPMKLDSLSDEFWISYSSIVTDTHRKPLFASDLSWTQPFGVTACLKTLKKMEKLWNNGCRELNTMIIPNKDTYAKEKIIQHQALANGILCMIRTAVNMVEFFNVRDRMYRKASNLECYRKNLELLRKIAIRELKNTRKGLECMRNNPLLGFDYIYHYAFTESMCQCKITHTERLIEYDIPFLLYCRGASSNIKPEWQV